MKSFILNQAKNTRSQYHSIDYVVCLCFGEDAAKMASVSVAVNFFENFQYYVSQNYHDLHGECEDCQAAVPEWELEQCQLGFCGRFFCRSCGFRCERCENLRDPRSVCLCTFHARSVRPFCTGCRKRFCDLCTTVTLKQVTFANTIRSE